MFLVRVILLSEIVFTVTAAACCGEYKNECKYDCTGIVCTSDLHCGGKCCIGDSRLRKGYCGACHKTKNCESFGVFGTFCLAQCCGTNDSSLSCLKTCEGISCTTDDHCDGECCVGDVGNKTCAPCPELTFPPPPPCTRNIQCPTFCCKFGTCFPRKVCVPPTRPSTPQPTTKRQCTSNSDCNTNCCKFGSCEKEEVCLSADRRTSPPTAKEKQCLWNIDCATNCCQFEKCVPRRNCHIIVTDSSPSKASGTLDSKTVIAIAIPIAGIIILVILSVVIYVVLIRGRKRTIYGAPQTTNHPAPPTVDNGAGQVTYHKVGNTTNPSGY